MSLISSNFVDHAAICDNDLFVPRAERAPGLALAVASTA